MIEKIGKILNILVAIAVVAMFFFMIVFLIKNGAWIFIVLMALVICVWAMAFKVRKDRMIQQKKWEAEHPEEVKEEEERLKNVKTLDEMRREAFPEKYRKMEEKQENEENSKKKEILKDDN